MKTESAICFIEIQKHPHKIQQILPCQALTFRAFSIPGTNDPICSDRELGSTMTNSFRTENAPTYRVHTHNKQAESWFVLQTPGYHDQSHYSSKVLVSILHGLNNISIVRGKGVTNPTITCSKNVSPHLDTNKRKTDFTLVFKDFSRSCLFRDLTTFGTSCCRTCRGLHKFQPQQAVSFDVQTPRCYLYHNVSIKKVQILLVSQS